MNIWPRKESVSRVDDRVDMNELAERLRAIPPLERPRNEFVAPRDEYSIDHIASFLGRHIKELDDTEATLAAEADAAKEHLNEVEHRRAVIKVARDTLAETLTRLAEKAAELEPPVEEPEEPPTAGPTDESEHERTAPVAA